MERWYGTAMNKEMTLVEHLTELRKRIIWTALLFIIALVLGFTVAGPVVEYLKSNLVVSSVSMHVFGLGEALRVYIQVAFLIAFIVTTPVILYHLWAFVAPGLEPKERKALLLYIPFAVIMLITGLLFAYYLLFPMVVGFLSGFTATLGVEETYGIAQYFQFMFNLVIPVGLVFELPIIILFLTAIRLLNPLVLIRVRKYAIFFSVVLAALITPPDFVSNILVAIPLILLYEFSIWLSRMLYRKQLREKEEEELATIKQHE
jgi:sec-independent protein translocase protein TatC